MRKIKGLLTVGLSLFIAAALWGCAGPTAGGPGAGSGPSGEGAGAEYVYTAKVRPGIETPEAAKRDLAGFMIDRSNQIGIKWYGEPGITQFAERNRLSEFLKGANGLSRYYYDSEPPELRYFVVRGIFIRDDRLEVSPRITFSYDKLADQPLTVRQSPDGNRYTYVVPIPGQITFRFHEDDLADAQRFADDLFAIQQAGKTARAERQKAQADRLALFEAKVAQYRAMKVKPPVTEGQRRFVVQANAANQHKDYGAAIDLYLKAVDLDPVSYPGAYFNLALLSAQVERFGEAISFMKQYLLLEPDAKDARSAQDKIYEWEFLMQKKQ
jgi:tetratricopeptide (TPR) repeat protein